MLALYINRLTAAIKPGTSFKLTRENPALTSAGDYTLDVTLPLRGCPQNQAIFGHLNRLDSSHAATATTRLPFTLSADNICITGTALVTHIDQDEVKVQLIAGRSSLTLAGTGEADEMDRYIDELDLGRAWDQFLYSYAGLSTYPDSMVELMTVISYPSPIGSTIGFTHEKRDKIRWGSSDQTDCVLFPIYSKEDNAYANAVTLNTFCGQESGNKYRLSNALPDSNAAPLMGFPILGDQGNTFVGKTPLFVLEWNGENTTYTYHADHVLAPQPYLVDIIERVLNAVGYEVGDNYLRTGDCPFKNLFIANARGTFYRARMLPHWTVREFLKEVQQFCGVWFSVEGHRVSILPIASLASGQQQVISSVIDTFTIDAAADSKQKSTATASVAYAFEKPDSTLFLPEEVWNMATITDTAEMPADTAAKTDANRNILYRHTTTNAYYAYFDTGAKLLQRRRVNQCGALHRNGDSHGNSADVKLRIVPAEMRECRARWNIFIPYGTDGKKWRLVTAFEQEPPYAPYATQRTDLPYLQFLALQTADTRQCKGYATFNIQAQLEDQEQDIKRDSREVMEVAINWTAWKNDEGQTRKKVHNITIDTRTISFSAESIGTNIPTALGTYVATPVDGAAWDKIDILAYSVIQDRFAFDLNESSSAIRKALDGSLAFDATAKVCIDFLDTDAFDPAKPFIIRGRHYVCEKIEYTIDDRGIQPLRRGYFYEAID